MAETQEELAIRVRELQKEVDRLHAQLKEKRFGLTWIDVPEAFEQESENRIPVLEEVPELAIHNHDGKPTHILIEGDNYHALTCLNYTHRGKVDVIYIDPPYNTGNDGFTYRDKRYLEEYPDGTPIDKQHPLRHSAWLSFISKRLILAKDLLSDKGLIFISIDENELARLRLLGDDVFSPDNFVGQWNWFKSATPPALSKKIKRNIEYVLCWQKGHNTETFRGVKKTSCSNDPFTKPQNSFKTLSFPKGSITCKLDDGIYPAGTYGTEKFPNELLDDLIVLDGKNKNEIRFKNRFIWLQETLFENINKGLYIELSKRMVLSYKRTDYAPEIPPNLIDMSVGVDTTENAGRQLTELFSGEKVFDYPKPISLLQYILHFSQNKNITVLDFFAGSGTTMHATMQLNAEDGGHRQCILCQINEADICKDVTYERNRRVIQGYTDSRGNDIPGLGNSLKYYRTAFVGKNQPKAATDDDKLTLARKAGCLLSLAENTLYETETTDYYQMFTDERNR
ncbi:MAG: site-specific DNA-methyltransferase, partial [Prevotella sp.]|nr:site-specific DNA-methyltransferase [Prevotella sp.]